MLRRILVPTDGSPSSATAIDFAIELAAAMDGSIVVFHAYSPFHGGAYGTADSARHLLAEAHEDKVKQAAAAIVHDATARAEQAGVPSETVTVESDRPWEAIIAVAKRKRCDAICMASHGRRGLSAVVLGSETAKVLTHCALPVFIIR